MFGLKITTKCKLDLMNKHIEDLTEDNLRLRETIENCELKSLKDYIILKATDYPCENCKIESKDCKKLIFSNQTICVTHKDNVDSFRARPKRNKKQ